MPTTIPSGWEGVICCLDVRTNMHLGLGLRGVVPLQLLPAAVCQIWSWKGIP